ncbi:MAG: hypothetical protein SFU85_08835 [Candidatus Methylacidiphilales bacterium]|nr:hypothetical protein [Candidatus Methylacidiphilales bacterium]
MTIAPSSQASSLPAIAKRTGIPLGTLQGAVTRGELPDEPSQEQLDAWLQSRVVDNAPVSLDCAPGQN